MKQLNFTIRLILVLSLSTALLHVHMDVYTFSVAEVEAKVEVRDVGEVSESQPYPQIISANELSPLDIEAESRRPMYVYILLVVILIVGWAIQNRQVQRKFISRFISLSLIITSSSVAFFSPYTSFAPDALYALASPPSVRAVGGFSNGGANITITLPTHQTDDLILIFIESNSADSPGQPFSYEHVDTSPHRRQTGNAAASTRLTIYWKIATSSSETNPVISDAGDHTTGFAMSFSGVATSGDPWNLAYHSGEGSGSGTFSLDGNTTTVTDTMIVMAVSASRDSAQTTTFANWTNVNLSNFTEQADRTFGGAAGGGIGVVAGQLSQIGTFGNTSVGITQQTVGEDWAAITLALMSTSSQAAADASSVKIRGGSVIRGGAIFR